MTQRRILPFALLSTRSHNHDALSPLHVSKASYCPTTRLQPSSSMDGNATNNAALKPSLSEADIAPAVSRQRSTIRAAKPHTFKRASDTTLTSPSSTSSAKSISPSVDPDVKDGTLTSFPPLPPSAENSPRGAPAPRSIPTLGGAPFASPTLKTASSKLSRETTPPAAARPVPAALEGLFEPSGSDEQTRRDALFDDQTPKHARNVPGTLHHQGTAHIEHLIARVGAVQLVKQLSEDLAQRDAQITMVQRRAEDRERLLRKMLRDCEVSNLDIEERLREGERERKARDESSGPLDVHAADREQKLNDVVSDQMVEALENDIGSGYDTESRAGTRRGSVQSGHTSVNGNGDAKRGASTVKGGWKSYFKYGSNGGTVRGTIAKPGESGTVRRRTDASAGDTSGTVRGRGDGMRPTPGDRTPSATASLQDHLRTSIKQAEDGADSASIKSSSSVASWAMKLVGGRPVGQVEVVKSHNARAKAASISGDTRKTDNTIAEVIPRTKSRNDTPDTSNKGAGNHVRGGSFATQLRNTAAASLPFPNSPPDADDTGISNLGPVEMETILPDDIRPPTLAENPAASGYLTDRFGFIYDQRRRKRQNEAAAVVRQRHGSMNVETLDSAARSLNVLPDVDDAISINSKASEISFPSRPDSPVSANDADGQKGWSDYLNIFSTKGELLSHTPAAAPITSITTGDDDLDSGISKLPTLMLPKRGSETGMSSITAPATNHVVSGNAEMALPSIASQLDVPKEPQPDPVQALLSQLTDVHDKLQRERTGKWNDFLRRVRAERSRTGDVSAGRDRRAKSIATMPETFLGDGEIIGVAGLGNKGKVGRAKWNEFRALVLAGIPVAFRAKIWAECSGASELRQPGYYEELVNSADKHDPSVAQQIQMDIHRTLTDNIFFRAGQGVAKLNEVLLAYARRNPEVGYCQGMNLIAANLLLIMPAAEDAFWVLCSMIESILPAKYFDNSLLTSRADQVVLRGYVSELLPLLSAHLESLNIDLEAFTFQWFLSVFTDCLSAEALFRVWDVVLCINDGATFLFQVALALLKLNEKQLLASPGPAEVYAYISQHMTDHAISIDGLIRASEGLRRVVRREDVIRRRGEAVERELEAIRARDALRKGKGKARAEALAAFPLDDTPPESADEQAEAEPAADSQGSTAASTPSGGFRSRRPSLGSEDDHEGDVYGELTIRTPMPMDEEASWMA
ncbi:hypothetical protein FH972_022392 [Carpinus fangiana]|uniref:Rab-GAP TBC domain-containing protein n=1 Tax=Carpinus fangiana TaxID=176857 RepID=A0A5N6KS46_9ROSI|nr:hypothetical protein FH972_022392 [Carpinus fangiana]